MNIIINNNNNNNNNKTKKKCNYNLFVKSEFFCFLLRASTSTTS